MEKTLLNLIPGACSPEVHLSQYDKGRAIPFKLAEGKSAYSVPDGSEIVVEATKPSGLGFVVPVTFDGDTATMTITETMSNEYGRFPAELSITNNGNKIGTANFVMNIERSPHPEGTIDGDAETILPELTLLVERVETAAASVLDMQVVANTLPAGSQATYSYDESLNKATFGIPQGEAGSGAVGTVASAYDASKTYAVGDYAIHNNDLYRCITAITTAETFTASHWTKIVLVDDVTGLKSDLDVQVSTLNRIVTKGETIDEYADFTLIDEKVINANRVIIDGTPGYCITEPISVIAGEKYKISGFMNWGNYLYVFYDTNGVAFGGVNSENTQAGTTLTDAVITIPSNAVSIRLGAYIDEQHPFSFKKSTIVNADKLVTQKWEGKKWLIVGDSFTENNATADKKYHKIISDITGIQVLNYGKSGTGYAKTYSTFENFRDRVLTLGSVDCDIITIAGSMNDISAGLDVGNADDTGTTTLAGYINATLDNLYSVKPFVQVGIILPLPIQGCTPNDTSDQGIKAIKYCNVLKEIAEKRSIPVCDLFHNSNLHPNYSNFRDEYYYNVDGVHPNNKGHAKFAPKVLDFLEQIIEL